jgi:hypothetical protein
MRRRGPRRCVVVLLWVGWLSAAGARSLAAQSMTFAQVGTIPGPAELVKAQGGYSYLAADKTLAIFDVSDPAAPTRLGAYTFPQKIWGFRLSDSLVYVAADAFGLGILDVSNPRAPTLRGSLKTPGQAKNVAVAGVTALVADMVTGVAIIDVSNPAKPIHVDSVFLEGYATDVVTSGSLAYAADRPTGFYVLDLAKPRPLEPVGTLQSAAGNGSAQLEVMQVSAQGPTLAVLVKNGLLQLFDVSNPAAPVAIPRYRTPGGAQRVSLKGALAYVADGREGLQVVDLSTPGKPNIIGTYKTALPARDVAVSDSLVFVVVGNGEVLILRQNR